MACVLAARVPRSRGVEADALPAVTELLVCVSDVMDVMQSDVGPLQG